jgi:LAIKA domain
MYRYVINKFFYYRTDDNKEGTFEVSLFAELFNEMLMRDSAFLLYRALANLPDKPKEKKKEDKKKDEKKSKEEDKKSKEEEKKENGEKHEEEEKDEDKKKEEKKEREEKRRRRDEEEEEEKKEMVTKDSDLLLGCSYFDLNHSGYFESKENSAVCSKDQLCYLHQ